MAKINDVHDIIVLATAPNFTAHTYTEVYGGSAGCTMTLNGTTVAIGIGSSIFINVRTVSGGTGCYLLGVNLNVMGQGSRVG